jgi:hypothetical protein
MSITRVVCLRPPKADFGCSFTPSASGGLRSRVQVSEGGPFSDGKGGLFMLMVYDFVSS